MANEVKQKIKLIVLFFKAQLKIKVKEQGNTHKIHKQ